MEDVFENLCDLHLHLGASVSPHFLWEIAHEQGISLPQKNYWQFLEYFKIKKTTSDQYLRSFDKDVSPFVLTQKIQSSPLAVEKCIHHIVSRAYREWSLKKVEIRFNPFLRNKEGLFDVDKIVLAATIGLHKAMIEYPIKAGIILETDRQFNRKYHQIIVEKAVKYKNMGVVGVDVSGPNPKDGFSLDSLIEPLDFAKKNGLKITFHTGEFTGVSEIWEVIKKISPHRIGHGIAAYKDKNLMEEIKRRNIVLEICPTSNIKTQVVKNWQKLRLIIQTFIANKVPFTINSDGPEFFPPMLKKNIKFLSKKDYFSNPSQTNYKFFLLPIIRMNKTKLLEKKLKQMMEGITFDDILLLPNYTDFKRGEVDLSVELHKKIKLKLPIISSPMDTVTEEKMAKSMAENGGLGIIHRNLSIEKQIAMVKEVKNVKTYDKKAAVDEKNRLLVGAALGVGEDFFERVKVLVKVDVDLLVLDSGHGFSKFIIDAVLFIKKNFPKVPLMAGNIATKEGALALVNAGVDILRVGMGPGSICTTRIVTGMGVPQLTAIGEAVKGSLGKAKIVADGGIKQPGDIAKALAFGADCVMLGSLLAGCDEAPGKTVEVNGRKYKHYRGMGSVAAMKQGAAERYGQKRQTEEKKFIAEGVEGLVEYKGKVSDFLYQIAGSLRSSFYYLGAKNIKEFFEKSRFVKISRAGIIESHPHSIVITDFGGNYNKKQ